MRYEDMKKFQDKDIMFKNQDPDEDNLEDLSSFRDNLIHSIFIEFNQYFPTEDFNSL